MSPKQILDAKTPWTAARRFAQWLQSQTDRPEGVILWNPTEAQAKGYGAGWTVCWEEGPFEWTMVSAGSCLTAGEFGTYSKPGPFPTGLISRRWYAEPYCNFVLSFYGA